MRLDELRALLEDDGFAVTSDRDAGLPRLVTVLRSQDQVRTFPLEIVYLPDAERQVESAKLLQFFVTVAQDVSLTAQDELRALVPRLNGMTPLMGFNLHEDGRIVYFRHVTLVPRERGSELGPVLLETVWLIHYVVDSFCRVVEAVASGASVARAWALLSDPGRPA